MATVPARCILFLCSYFPLVAIICVLQYDVWPWWVTALLGGVVGIGSLLGTWIYFGWMLKTETVQRGKVTSFSKHDDQVMGYIASYLIPLVAFQLDQLKQVIVLLIFVAVLLIIYVSSNMIYINPMLSLVGYHLYEIEIEQSKRSRYYIARKPLDRYPEIRFVRLSDDIFLEKRS